MTGIERERRELFDVADILDRMSGIELRQYKVKMLAEISDRERIVFGINDVLNRRGQNNAANPIEDTGVPRLWS